MNLLESWILPQGYKVLQTAPLYLRAQEWACTCCMRAVIEVEESVYFILVLECSNQS